MAIRRQLNPGTGLNLRLAASISRFDDVKRAIRDQIRVALPGIVQSFNPGPPATVTCLIACNEWGTNNAGTGGIVQLGTTSDQLPLLYDVPVLMPTAGGWSATLPIQPGDECLLVIADTALEVWLQNGGTNNNPISQRRHDLSDAIAIFGLRSTPRGLSNYSTTSAQLRSDDGTVVIDLAPTQITITAPNVQVNCTNTATVQAQTVDVTASQTVNITGDSQVMIGNATKVRDFLTHIHGGVQGGAGTTGGVV